jgi:PhnB protein
MAAKPIPDGYHALTPYLIVEDASKAIEFYKRAFGAKERGTMPAPDGRVAHAELEIGDSVLMISDPFEEATITPPNKLGGTSGALFMYVEDADAVIEQAAEAGATVTQPPEDMFWGDRFGKVTDPFGHEWQIATHIEDLELDEIMKRGQEAMAGLS